MRIPSNDPTSPTLWIGSTTWWMTKSSCTRYLSAEVAVANLGDIFSWISWMCWDMSMCCDHDQVLVATVYIIVLPSQDEIIIFIIGWVDASAKNISISLYSWAIFVYETEDFVNIHGEKFSTVHIIECRNEMMWHHITSNHTGRYEGEPHASDKRLNPRLVPHACKVACCTRVKQQWCAPPTYPCSNGQSHRQAPSTSAIDQGILARRATRILRKTNALRQYTPQVSCNVIYRQESEVMATRHTINTCSITV